MSKKQTLSASLSDAKTLYEKGSESDKKLLEKIFGVEHFREPSPQEKIKTFEDVLNALPQVNENVKILLDYNGVDPDMLGAQAMLKLTLIARALNGGWQPDWSNGDQKKYYPWFEISAGSSGLGFSSTHFVFVSASTGVGSRLCFKSSELAIYAAKQFEDVYNQFLLTR